MAMDRIGGLPDELLINILNFLPTKYAFIATILSRRWSYLYKEVNQLNFDDSRVFNSSSSLHHDNSCVAFRAFVSKMLERVKVSNLVRFRFKTVETCGWCFFEVVCIWLNGILNNGIQEIDLRISAPVLLPHSLFTCKTLCILKLNVFAELDIPDTVSMPCLKILHLKQVEVVHVDSINRIFLGCHDLHDFFMELHFWYCKVKLTKLSLSGPSLTKLKLCNTSRFFWDYSTPLVAIVSSLLQCLHYVDTLAKSYSVTTSKKLVEAQLNISNQLVAFGYKSAISRSARELIQGVSSVKCLFLSADCRKAATDIPDKLPILCNLTKLKLPCLKNLHVTLPR